MRESNATKKAYFLQEALEKIDHFVEMSVQLRTDNQTTIKFAHNSVNHFRIKHIFVHYHYVRELIQQGTLNIEYINIKNMLADELIKTLRSKLLKRYVRMLDMTNDSIRE